MLTDAQSELLIGGGSVDANDAAAFVNDWHHLGKGHVSPQDDKFFPGQGKDGDPSQDKPVNNGLHNFVDANDATANVNPGGINPAQ